MVAMNQDIAAEPSSARRGEREAASAASFEEPALRSPSPPGEGGPSLAHKVGNETTF